MALKGSKTEGKLKALAAQPLLQIGRPPLGHAHLLDDVVSSHVCDEQPVDEGLAHLELGETVAEGTVATWHKQEGDTVEVDDILA